MQAALSNAMVFVPQIGTDGCEASASIIIVNDDWTAVCTHIVLNLQIYK